MNFSVQNNSLSRPTVVSPRLFELTGRVPSIDRYFFNINFAKLIRSGRAHLLTVALCALLDRITHRVSWRKWHPETRWRLPHAAVGLGWASVSSSQASRSNAKPNRKRSR